MQFWSDLVAWGESSDGWRVLSTFVFPFVAVLVAGVVAALIGRASVRRLIVQHDRDVQASAVTALIAAGRRATVWSSLSGSEQEHVDQQASEAEIRVRLLPLSGAALAAEWAEHELAEMKRNSANFSFQAEQTYAEYRDRLILWRQKPGRARKLFKDDIERWAYEATETPDPLVERQQAWAASHAPIHAHEADIVEPRTQRLERQEPLAPAAPATLTPATPTRAPLFADDASDDGVSTDTPPPVTASALRARSTSTVDDLDR
jgi:hypothetical protein